MSKDEVHASCKSSEAEGNEESATEYHTGDCAIEGYMGYTESGCIVV